MAKYKYFISGVVYTSKGDQGVFNTQVERPERITDHKQITIIEKELLPIMKEQDGNVAKVCIQNFIMF